MHPNDLLGSEPADFGRDEGAAVVADRSVAVVPETPHQLHPRSGDAVAIPASLPGWAGEAEAGQGWDDQVKVLSQGLDDVEVLYHCTRPAVAEDQGEGILLGRT